MPRSVARVSTSTPERFAKQLTDHLGHRVPVTHGPDGIALTFGSGTALISSEEATLVMLAESATEAGLAEVQDVLARHLIRFGQRQALSVQWQDSQDSLDGD
jgi:hypothetical protein